MGKSYVEPIDKKLKFVNAVGKSEFINSQGHVVEATWENLLKEGRELEANAYQKQLQARSHNSQGLCHVEYGTIGYV